MPIQRRPFPVMPLVLRRRLNARVIELRDDTLSQTVGYLLDESGEYHYTRWLGFVNPIFADGERVLLEIEAVGCCDGSG